MKKEVDKVMSFAQDRRGNVDVPKLMAKIDKSPAKRQLEKIVDDILSQ